MADQDMDMAGGGGMAPAPDAGGNTVMLTADLLGGLKPKAGDTLTFIVSGEPDSEGNVSGTWQMAGGGGKMGGGMDSWEKDFRQSMSAQNPDESA